MRNLPGNLTSSPAAPPDSQDQVWALGAHDAPEVVLTLVSIFEVLSEEAFDCMERQLCGVGLALEGEPHPRGRKTYFRIWNPRGSFFSPCWMAGGFFFFFSGHSAVYHPSSPSLPALHPYLI